MTGEKYSNTQKKGTLSNPEDFAGHLQKQANVMAQGGWTKEATDLRKWVSELKKKSHKIPLRF